MLPETGFLQTASPELVALLNNISVVVKRPPNTLLFSENDAGDALYIVGQGAVEISVLSGEGRKLGLEIMRRGSVFGEIALFDPGPRTATAITMDACTLYEVRNVELLRAIRATYIITHTATKTPNSFSKTPKPPSVENNQSSPKRTKVRGSVVRTVSAVTAVRKLRWACTSSDAPPLCSQLSNTCPYIVGNWRRASVNSVS